MIHYSFPRHMSYALIVARHENMKKYCAENGIELVDVTAPDPTGDAGITGAQQFILEDVPRQIEKYGKDTVFFTTNCGMQEPLIRSVFENGAIYTPVSYTHLGDPHKRWSMWFNSKQREEPYQVLTSR